jgi:hypothetical protein
MAPVTNHHIQGDVTDKKDAAVFLRLAGKRPVFKAESTVDSLYVERKVNSIMKTQIILDGGCCGGSSCC